MYIHLDREIKKNIILGVNILGKTLKMCGWGLRTANKISKHNRKETASIELN